MYGRFSYCFNGKSRGCSLNKNLAKTVNYLTYYHPLILKIISFLNFENTQIKI